MNEFKTVVESFRDDIKRVVENLDLLANQNDRARRSFAEQIGKNLEVQTEIKYELKTIREGMGKLDRRVTKIEQ